MSNQPYLVTDTSSAILPSMTTNSGTINVYQPQALPVQASAPPKRLPDREWLDAEIDAVCETVS